MNRSAVLQAVAKAASAAALGRDDAAEQRSLDGDRFEVRIRFGCAVAGGAAAPAKGPFNVRFDEKERTLRLRATPDLDHADALCAPAASFDWTRATVIEADAVDGDECLSIGIVDRILVKHRKRGIDLNGAWGPCVLTCVDGRRVLRGAVHARIHGTRIHLAGALVDRGIARRAAAPAATR